MKCWHCRGKVIWGGDHTYEDCGVEGNGIVTNMSCSTCNAEYLIYLGENNDKEKNANQ